MYISYKTLSVLWLRIVTCEACVHSTTCFGLHGKRHQGATAST